MPARFDSMQSNAVDKVNNLYGYPTVWNPSDNTPQQTAIILFKDPSSAQDLSGIREYDPLKILMEYKISDLVGLRDAANSNKNEIVIIDGDSYYVRQVNPKYDGKTFVAILETIDDPDADLDSTLNSEFKG